MITMDCEKNYRLVACKKRLNERLKRGREKMLKDIERKGMR